jgi:hypothetical protein
MARSVVVTSTNYQHLRKVNILTSPVAGTSPPVWTTEWAPATQSAWSAGELRTFTKP